MENHADGVFAAIELLVDTTQRGPPPSVYPLANEATGRLVVNITGSVQVTLGTGTDKVCS